MTVDSDVLESARAHYLVAALEGRSRNAATVLDMVLLKGIPTADVVSEVLAPVQAEIGSLWQDGTISIAEEHVASAITSACLHLPRLTEAPRPDRGRSADGQCRRGVAHPSCADGGAHLARAWVGHQTISPSVPAADLGEEASRGIRCGGRGVVLVSSTPDRCLADRVGVARGRYAGDRRRRLFDGSSELAERIGADVAMTPWRDRSGCRMRSDRARSP